MTPEESAENLAAVWARPSDVDALQHDVLVHLLSAIAEEREACAKVSQEWGIAEECKWERCNHYVRPESCIAAAIRARA